MHICCKTKHILLIFLFVIARGQENNMNRWFLSIFHQESHKYTDTEDGYMFIVL